MICFRSGKYRYQVSAQPPHEAGGSHATLRVLDVRVATRTARGCVGDGKAWTQAWTWNLYSLGVGRSPLTRVLVALKSSVRIRICKGTVGALIGNEIYSRKTNLETRF